jgi:predicted signal transduction protein with EAL and GGDEF domain
VISLDEVSSTLGTILTSLKRFRSALIAKLSDANQSEVEADLATEREETFANADAETDLSNRKGRFGSLQRIAAQT